MTLDSHHRIDMQRYYLGYMTSNFPDTLHVFQGSSDCWIVSRRKSLGLGFCLLFRLQFKVRSGLRVIISMIKD